MKIVDFEQNRRLRAAVPQWLSANERSWAWLARQVCLSPSLFTLWIQEKSNISKEKLDKIESLIESNPA